MKKGTKILMAVIVIILLTMTALWYLFSKKGNQIFYKVPKESVSVLVINAPALSSKLFMDEIGSDNKISSRIAKYLPDSLSDIDWNSNGLALFNKLVLFTLEDSSSVNTAFIIRINDADKFNLLMKKLGSKLDFLIDKKNDIQFAYSPQLEIIAAWNDHFVTGIRSPSDKDKNLNLLLRVLSTPQKQSMMSDSSFVKLLAGNDDVFLYTKPYKQVPVKELETVNSGLKSMTAYLNFNRGELDFRADVTANNGSMLDNVFVNNKQELRSIVNTDSAIINLRMSVDPFAMKQLSNKFRMFDFKTTGTHYFDCWDGSLNLILMGGKKIENEYITYSFDDNFNKIEQKEIKADYVLNMQTLAGYRQNILDSLSKINPPVKKGHDTLLVKGGNFVLTKMGRQLVVYNRFFAKPGTVLCKDKNNFQIKVDCQKLLLVLKEIGFDRQIPGLNNTSCKSISVSISKEKNINIAGKLYFIDRKKNAFYSIFEMIEKR